MTDKPLTYIDGICASALMIADQFTDNSLERAHITAVVECLRETQERLDLVVDKVAGAYLTGWNEACGHQRKLDSVTVLSALLKPPPEREAVRARFGGSWLWTKS